MGKKSKAMKKNGREFRFGMYELHGNLNVIKQLNVELKKKSKF